MPSQAIVAGNADVQRKIIGKTVYVIKSVYSGKESIDGKISKLILRKAENRM